MGYIKKLKNNELVGGTDKTTVYPVTSAEAVFEEVSDGEFKSQKYLNNHITNERIVDNTIENQKLKDDTIDMGKLNTQLKTIIQNAYDASWKVKEEPFSLETKYDANDVVYDPDTNSSYVSLTADNQGNPVRLEDEEEVNPYWRLVINGISAVQATEEIEATKDELIDYIQENLKDQVDDEIADAESRVAAAEQYAQGVIAEAEQTARSISGIVYQTVAATPNYTDTIPVQNKAVTAQIGYYTCSGGSGATIIVDDVDAAAFTPVKGGHIKILMTEKSTVTSGNVQLQFGSVTATKKVLLYNEETISSSNTWEPGEVISVYYDGTCYQASNSQGGSNKKINAYLYDDVRTLAVGQTYNENEAVKTTDKQFLRTTKEIKTMNLVNEVAEGDLNAITSGANLGTYKALKEVKNYNGTETEGLYSIGKPSIVTITVDSSSLSIAEDTDITVIIGNDSKTITVPAAASETKDADVAALIKAAFTSVPGWNLTDNEDGTLTLKCTTAGNNTISISSDTGETGLAISSNAVNGNSVLNQYNNGVWETVDITTWVADSAMWESLDENGLSAYTKQNTVTKDINVKLYGEYDYYTDGTYITKGTTADASTNWISFPIVKGHTYRIWLKSDKAYFSNSGGAQLYMSNIGLLGTPTVAEMLAGCYRDKTVPAKSTATSSGVHLNAGSCIGGVEIYVKVIDLTDATTQAIQEVTKPSVLLPKDVVNNLVDGGTEKVLSAEMGREIGKAINPTRDLELKPLANCYWGNDMIPTSANNATHVTTKDLIMLPKQGLTLHYKLPNNIYIRAGFTTRSNPQTGPSWLGWTTGEGYFTIPNNRVFYRVSFGRGSSQNQNISVSEVEQMLENRDIVLEYDINPYDESWDIIKRNEHNRYILSSYITGGKSSGLTKLPVFVHSSDIHSDRVRLRNFMKFADHISANAAFVTGDMVWSNASCGAGFLGIVADEYNTPMLICDGNHDAYSYADNSWYNWRNDTYRYNNLFKHLAEKNSYKLNGDTISTKCYYYYDIPAVSIRVIAIDLYEYSSSRGTDSDYFSTTQQQWLKDTMSATPNGYGIIILDHEMIGDPQKIAGAEEFWVQYGNNNAPDALKQIVDAFIGRTGDFAEIATTAEFIMYCNGHNHWDMIGYVQGVTHKQLCCNVDLNNAYYAGSTSHENRFPRIPGDQSEDLFNVYGIDRANKQVRIARVGANMTGDFTKVEYAVVKYAD